MAAMRPKKPDGGALKKLGAKWLARIDTATKLEKDWLDDAEAAVAAYTSEAKRSEIDPATSSLWKAYDFNILFSNVETIVPAVINSPPAPDIRRRFADEDPAAKDVSELIERAIRVQVDDSKLQVELEGVAQDGFLAGRGVIRLRFRSEFEEDEPSDAELEKLEARSNPGAVGERELDDADLEADTDGAGSGYGDVPQAEPAAGTGSKPKNERICFEAISWRDYRHGPAKRWDERPWEAFRFVVDREDKDFFDQTAIDAQIEGDERKQWDESDNELVGWEIWCRNTKKVYFIDDKGYVLKTVPDPLGLSNFYATANPIQPVELVGRLKPVNPFSIYRKLAEEVDLSTKRINILLDQMKVKGWYAGSAEDLANVVSAENTDFVPIANAEIWAQNGGIEAAIAFWPFEKFAVAIKELYAAREQAKQAIYEITGISDIVRGASSATETATAQQIKTQWGSLRIQKFQRLMERCARDLFVMMSEIIPSKFSHETLQQMTGIQLIPTQQDLQPIQLPPMPPPGQQPPPELQQAMQQAQQAEQARQAKLQQLQAIGKLLSQRLAMFYRIDVESDSTVKADLTRQKQETTEFLQGAGAYWTAMGPLVADGTMPKDVAVEIFMSISRLFNLGKSVEDTLDQMAKQAKQPQPEKPNPEAEKAKAEMDLMQQKAQLEAQSKQLEIQAKAKEMEMSQQAMMMDHQRSSEADARKMQVEQQKAQIDLQKASVDLQIKLVDLELKKQESALSLQTTHASNAMKLDAQKQANELKAANGAAKQ
ncbi:hypothetical protein [Mesorhizobium sp. WSM4303]|uniref:hypothetical protein n=1 Tax=Mesorhizobium sp. WSM4303 TaxID=2589887 RepID=UPI00163D8CCF|nr:hypothetical protein [Mesorhizobium sp. WSM4303]